MSFIKKHKILTSVIIVAVSLCMLAFGTCYYFLDKINIDDSNAAAETTGVNFESIVAAENDIPDFDSLDKDDRKTFNTADEEIRQNLANGKIWKSDSVLNILLLGTDYGTASSTYGRSDAMIILSVNKAVQKVKLISISRNVYVAIPGFNNSMISHAHIFGGPALSIKTVEQNYKIGIDNYVSCGFDSFVKIINILGGVRLTLSEIEAKAMSKYDSSITGAGSYLLNGETALQYSRQRYFDSDKNRTERQRKLLSALADKFKSITVKQALKIVNTVLPLVNTDMKKSEIIYQLASAVRYLSWEREQYYLPAKSYDYVMKNGYYVNFLDWPYELNYAHELIYEGVIPEYKEQS